MKIKGDTLDFYKKLNKIEPRIKEESFLENKGLSNEVAYYIFDYDPEHELEVRAEVKRLKDSINSNSLSFKIIEFDLYEIVLKILEDYGYLEDVFEFEKDDGIDETIEAIVDLLMLNSEENLIVDYIIENTCESSVVFLTGVGKAYPIVRSHNVLNNLNQILDEVPVVLFFPGTFSGYDLMLFNDVTMGNNYYRALPLIQGE